MDARALALDDGTLLEELGWVHGLACRLMGDANDADDLVQEAWLKARSTPAERFASRSRLRAWLAAVTRRLARDTRRSRQRRARREERAAQSEILGSPGDVVERSALLEDVLHAVRALDEPYRSTVLLRYMDGYSTAEVAATMQVTEEAVRKRLSRALARLRGHLAGEWGGALPACIGDSLGTAPRSAPPRSVPGAGLWASLGLALLAVAGLRAPGTSTSGDDDRTAPEASSSALHAHSSSEGSGAVLPEVERAEEPAVPEPAVAQASPDEPAAASATEEADPGARIEGGASPDLGPAAPGLGLKAATED